MVTTDKIDTTPLDRAWLNAVKRYKTEDFKRCFCGCSTFLVTKPAKQWRLICRRCKCERVIASPGIAVTEYSVSVPFKGDPDDCV